LQFREATIDDAEPLAALLKNIGWFESFKSATARAAGEGVRRQLAIDLADDSHSVYVAVDDSEKIIGYIAAHWLPYLFMSGPEGYVSELFVRKAARGQSVGRGLLQLKARRRGCTRLSLINLRHRESYRRQFYLKAGWQERTDAANFIYAMA
jgi:GNAT superfamily N-acetyltransferase